MQRCGKAGVQILLFGMSLQVPSDDLRMRVDTYTESPYIPGSAVSLKQPREVSKTAVSANHPAVDGGQHQARHLAYRTDKAEHHFTAKNVLVLAPSNHFRRYQGTSIRIHFPSIIVNQGEESRWGCSLSLSVLFKTGCPVAAA